MEKEKTLIWLIECDKNGLSGIKATIDQNNSLKHAQYRPNQLNII